jgi:hypothetical protein
MFVINILMISHHHIGLNETITIIQYIKNYKIHENR